jgi:hypothetical protein
MGKTQDTESLTVPTFWEPLLGAMNVPGTGSVANLLDTNSAIQSQHFYRVRLKGGDVSISFPAQSGKSYRVERTDNLVGLIFWTTVPGAENVAGAGEIVQVIDIGGAGQPQRFYRVTVN